MKRKIISLMLAVVLVLSFSLVTAVPVAAVNGAVLDREAAILAAADRVVDNQNDDGGYGWVLGNPSSHNVVGITSISILKAHELVDNTYEIALAEAYRYAVEHPSAYEWEGDKYEEVTPRGVDSFPDITFLVWLAQAAQADATLLAAIQLSVTETTVADIADLAQTRWDDRVTYLGASVQGDPPNGTATAMAEWFRDWRHGITQDALILWDLEAGVKAAQALASYFPEAEEYYNQQAIDIAEVLYASIDNTGDPYFDSMDHTQTEYVLGLTGAIEAFVEVGDYSTKVTELKLILIDRQQHDGSWQYYSGATPVDWSVQSTAYAVMALLKQGDDDSVVAARKGADWLVKNQLPEGGWYMEGGEGLEYTEMDSEAAWALATAEAAGLPAPVTIGDDGYYFIQSAIDAAQAGDIINVAAGLYAEDLSIPDTKTTLELVGADGATIKGVAYEDSSKFPLAAANIEILADGVSIHGFTIQGPDPLTGYFSSGMIIGAADVEIYENAFEVTNSDAGDGADISQGLQTYNKRAIPGVDISGLSIHDNTFTSYGAGDVGYEGIYVNRDEGTGDVTVGPLNDFTGVIVRAITTERSSANISGNEITATGGWAWTGVLVMDLGGYYDEGCEPIDSVSMTGNTIEGFDNALKLGKVGTSTQTLTNISITENTLQGNDVGILVRSSANGVVVDFNDISGNTYGVENIDAAHTLKAEHNWWGDATGPDPETELDNPHGAAAAGDVVSDNVDFIPWYATETTTPDTDYVSVERDGVNIAISDTIQGGIDAATASGTVIVIVAAGTYNENITIDRTLTLEGAQAGKDPTVEGARTNPAEESTIQGSGGVAVTISADNVTIDGFQIENPTGNAGIRADGQSYITIKNNIVTNIDGVASGTGNQGIAIAGGATTPITDITIEDNQVNDIKHTAVDRSAIGIWIGNMNGSSTIDNLVIQRNTVSNIFANTSAWGSGGYGAYGILIGYGGQTVGAQVLDNTISNLEGLWAHGIGLECDTPGAVVERNNISNLTDHKTPSDAVAVQVEDNPSAATLTIEFNSVNNVNVGVQNTVELTLVTAENNWWGHSSGTVTSGIGEVDIDPWLLTEGALTDENLRYEKTLALKDGWTLISVDKAVDDSAWVLGGVSVAYKYTPSGGFQSEVTTADLEPLSAIYVKTDGGGGVGINYPATPDPSSVYSKALEAGWNLIGIPSMVGDTETDDILSSLRYVTVEMQQVFGLTTLVSQGDYNQFSDSFYRATLTETNWDGLPILEPFDGYWAYMEAADTFEVIPIP